MQQLKLQFRCKELKIGDMVRILSKHNDVWHCISWKKGDIAYVCKHEKGWWGAEIVYFLAPQKDSPKASSGHFTREDLEVIEYARS